MEPLDRMRAVGVSPEKGSALEFPCALPIKVLGRNLPGLREHVLAIVRSHCPATTAADVVERQSRNGAYLSFTITVELATRAQADAVFESLSADERILIVL